MLGLKTSKGNGMFGRKWKHHSQNQTAHPQQKFLGVYSLRIPPRHMHTHHKWYDKVNLLKQGSTPHVTSHCPLYVAQSRI